METHNDEFVCNICNKQYKNKSGIWKHNNIYHNKTSNKYIQCNMFKKQTEQRTNKNATRQQICVNTF